MLNSTLIVESKSATKISARHCPRSVRVWFFGMLKERRKAGLVPPRGQEGAEAAARSLVSDSVTPKTRQKTALGSNPSEA
ncbi:MAG TPA: hypothetical protein VIX91_06485, partial [Candidatus Acidoferrum sp.]